MTLPTACWPLWALLAGTLPPDGRAIVAAMHDRYAGKWYATLTFVQHNTATRPDDSTEHSTRSEEHTSELQSQSNLVCRLLLEKKKTTETTDTTRVVYQL